MEKRKWSKEEKLAILKEAESEGVELTTRKLGIYPSTFYSCRQFVQSYSFASDFMCNGTRLVIALPRYFVEYRRGDNNFSE